MTLLLIISIVYLGFLWFIIKRINSYSLLSNNQKKANIIMCVLLPVIWIPLVYSLTKPSLTNADLKKIKEKERIDKTYPGNISKWEITQDLG
jgi:hypothetical protein